MAMNTTLALATALSVLNSLALAGLLVVWLRNYRTFRTPMTLGLVAFAAVLLVENLVAVYFFFSMQSLFAMSTTAETAVLAMRALQSVALAFLTYVTMQ
nr:hypothetical protein [Haloglomus sp. DT116]